MTNTLDKIKKTSNEIKLLKLKIEQKSTEVLKKAINDSNITKYKQQFKNNCEEAEFDNLGINCESPEKFFNGVIEKGKNPIRYFRQKASLSVAAFENNVTETLKAEFENINLIKECKQQFKLFENKNFLNFNENEAYVLNKSRDKTCEAFSKDLINLINDKNVTMAKNFPKKMLQIYGKTLSSSLEDELAEHLWENDLIYAYNDSLNKLNKLKVSFKEKTYGICVKTKPSVTTRIVTQRSK